MENKDMIIDEFLEDGEKLYSLGEYEQLANLCNEFLRVKPDDRVLSMLSSAEFALGDFPAAEDAARRGIRVNRGNPDNLFNLAYVLEKRGRLSNAYRCFARAAAASGDEAISLCRDEMDKLEARLGKSSVELMPPKANRRVLIIAAIYPPLAGSGVQRTVKLVKYLRLFNWEPVVVTLDTNSVGQGGDEYFDELPDDIEVVRIAPRTSLTVRDMELVKSRLASMLSKKTKSEFESCYKHQNSIRGQVSLLSFPESTVFWAYDVADNIGKFVDMDRIDLIYSTSGPYSDHFAAYYIKQNYRKPWVADFRDEWSNNPEIWPNKNSLRYHICLDCEKAIFDTAEQVIVIQPAAKDYCKRLGFNPDKFTALTNGYDEEDFEPISPGTKRNDKFTLIHNGILYLNRRATPVLEALGRLVNNGKVDKDKFFFHMGSFQDKRDLEAANELAVRLGISDLISATPYMEHSESVSLAAKADMLVLLMEDNTKTKTGMTGKIFEYLRFRRPILAIGSASEFTCNTLAKTKRGRVYQYSDIDGIASAILTQYEHWKHGDIVELPLDNNVTCFERRAITSVHASVFDKAVRRFPGQSLCDSIILTDVYPSDEHPYANMFVHTRIKHYQKRGFDPKVFCLRFDGKFQQRRYENVDVTEGDAELLQSILDNGHIRLVMVHFLYFQMWQVIKPRLGKIRAIIYCHGWEIQPWQRRIFNYKQEELERQKKISNARMTLWKDVFSTALNCNDVHFVFVSQYFANEVMSDHQVELPNCKYSVIHNVIDTDVFIYAEKSAEQRKRIFSLSNYANRKYANDLTIIAIRELSKYPEFADMEFLIAGQGLLWEGLTASLRKYKNVKLLNSFFSHKEIAEKLKKYGIFLAPTRWDSQGVSRDEAMSCGCVPVTNAAAAIPEFVDDDCGMLCPTEDGVAIADAILKLYREPELFMKLSRNAAARIRRQSAPEIVITKELELFEHIREGIEQTENDTKNQEKVFPENIESVKIQNNVMLSGYRGEYVFNRVKSSGKFYENHILSSWFKPNMFKTVFDIGANLGNHTLFFASNSPDAEIYSFEPMPANYKLLECNVRNNHLEKRVHLYNKAVGAESGTVQMSVSIANNNGTAKIVDGVGTEMAEVLAIDELNLPIPDFVKIDTEGYEINVLKGMYKTLERSNALVWIEVDDHNAFEVYRIMDSLGYRLIDFFLESSNNVLFGRKNQTLFPVGYSFVRLLSLNKELLMSNLQLQRTNLGLKQYIDSLGRK